MSLFNDAVTESVRLGLCTLLVEGEDLFEWMAVQIFGKQLGDSLTESEMGELGALQKALGRGVCLEALDTDYPTPTIPFTGGQCAGIVYSPYYDISYTNFAGNRVENEAGFLAGGYTGAIQAFALEIVPVSPTIVRLEAIIVDGNGTLSRVEVNSSLHPNDSDLVVNQLSMISFPTNTQCGDPPISVTKDTAPSIEVPFEYQDKNGNIQSLSNTEFTFGDVYLSPNGDLSIKFENSDLSIEGDVNLLPEFKVRPKNPISSSNNNPKRFDEKGDGDEEPSENLDESPAVEEIDDDDEPLIGVIIKSQEKFSVRRAYTEVPNGTAPVLIIPRIAWVCFKVKNGREKAWLDPIDVRSVDAYIPCPHIDGAIAYSVQWSNEWKGKAYAIKGKPLSTLLAVDDD